MARRIEKLFLCKIKHKVLIFTSHIHFCRLTVILSILVLPSTSNCITKLTHNTPLAISSSLYYWPTTFSSLTFHSSLRFPSLLSGTHA
ncbi:hypothetical protein BT69DRAFT_685576 [Atractiella rhizophila]|nr:hypothetical protein BT69DRAFT_685576 [Atractiella rhizophila]